MKALVVALALLLAGCAQTITLRHPADGRRVVCGPYAGNVPGTMLLRGCAEDFQRQGYERVPE